MSQGTVCRKCRMYVDGDYAYHDSCAEKEIKETHVELDHIRAVNKTYEDHIAESAAVYAELDRLRAELSAYKVVLSRAEAAQDKAEAELSSLRELAENLEKLESAILATKFSDDESWAACVARVMSAHLLEGETIISPVQRRAGDVEVIAKVLHEAEFQSDYETVSESGKEECRRIARILSHHLLEGEK